MPFTYKKNMLQIDGVSLKPLVEKYGTPLYVYSDAVLRANVASYQKALRSLPHRVCYAMKANSNGTVISTLAQMGCGADIVSGGELFRALRAGIPANKIVYAGVGKTDEEICKALCSNILMFNVESLAELTHINRCAQQLRKKARVSIRVNPDVNPKTHPHISTGLLENKFGIDITTVRDVYRYAAAHMSNGALVGVHMHIGSQILDVTPYKEALEKVCVLIEQLRSDGINLSYVNMGGGLGIPYKDTDAQIAPHVFIAQLMPYLKKMKCTIIVEPGRSIVGDAGVLITKVLYKKQTGRKQFVIVDAGMNDLARPSLYNAYHAIVPLMMHTSQRETMVADIVGPICESTDFLAKAREITDVAEGEYLVVKNAGAYSFSMSSNYNSRMRAAEVMIRKGKARLVRKRETLKDLVRGEK